MKTNINRQRILVIDDETSVTVAVKTALEDEYNVITATNTSGAFSYLSKFMIDVALLDIRMPGADGLDVLGKIKKRHPHVAVIILTAYASEDDIQKAMNLGAYSIIIKPFDVRELRDSVEKAMAQK